MAKLEKVKIENNGTVAIHGLKPGGKLDVEIDRDGTIIPKLWRRRVADNDDVIVLTGEAAKKIGAIKKKIADKKADVAKTNAKNKE